MFSNGLRFVLCALTLIGMLGCPGMPDPIGPEDQDPNKPKTTIGPAGGEVQLDSGAKVIVPAGALAAEVEIELGTDGAGAPQLPEGYTALGAITSLLPHGTQFAIPVTLRLPFDPALLPSGATARLLKGDPGGSFGEVAATVDGNALVAEITSFSFVQAAAGPVPAQSQRLTVNSAADTTDGGDGLLTLREALASATAGVETTIVLEAAAFFNPATAQVTPIELQGELAVPAGALVTIDGSLTIPLFNAVIRGSTDPQKRDRLMTIPADAVVTLRDVTLADTSELGTNGVNGVDGANGVDGTGCPNQILSCQSGTDGTDGTDGADAAVAPTSGSDAVGGIFNEGTLTLERVTFSRLEGRGGQGGAGGNGGRGGRGGNGGDESLDQIVPPFSGGDGGNGGDATHGADGGIGAGAILNRGKLIVRDVRFGDLLAQGGDGGAGGAGGRGGAGGYYGRLGFRMPPYTWRGGDGGDAGLGGNAGDGGAAAAAIFNLGEVTFDGVQGLPAATTNVGGDAGQAGASGVPGDFGFERGGTNPNNDLFKGTAGNPARTDDGAEKPLGDAGQAGLGQNFVNASPTVANCIYVDVARETFSDSAGSGDRTVYILFSVIGGAPAGQSVRWAITPGAGVNAADFDGGLPAGGLVEFNGSSGVTRSFRIAAEGVEEGAETFTITLSEPTGGELGWSRSVTVTIVD